MAAPRDASRRLLFLTAESWPTFRQDVAALFGHALPALGVRSDLATVTDQPPPLPRWGGGALMLRRVGGGAARRRLAAVWHAVATMLRAPRADYAAIQVRDMPVVATLALLVGRVRRLPVYYWMSYPIPEGQIALARERGLSAGPMKYLYPLVSGHVGRLLLWHAVLPRADHVFVQSERMRDELQACGIARQRMTPVPMGVDLQAVDAAVAGVVPPRSAGRRVVGYLGSLDRPRGIETLFEMLRLVRLQVPEAVLLVVGDTEDEVHRRWLRDQARAHGVAEHVEWTGWLPTVDGWRRMLEAEVALSPVPRGPLLDVGSPTKVPEYLALGLPVVCNDNPDQQAVVGVSGAGRCVPFTAEAFAAAVVDLLQCPPAERAAMAAAGRRHVAAERDYRRIARDVAAAYSALGVGPTTAAHAAPRHDSPREAAGTGSSRV